VSDPIVERLKAALAIFLKTARVKDTVLLFVKDEPPPGGRHILAWTYPADAYLEGPGGSLAIAIQAGTLSRPWPELLHILAHEVGHAKHDAKALRRGDPVGEKDAEHEAEKLMADCVKELEALGS